MHRISLIGPIALFLALVSCEKDIDIDYRQVAPLYVVEANVNQDRSTVRITMTQNMDDNSNNHGVEGATVVISSGDSISRRLNYSRDGYYSAALPGKPGTRYNLTIDVDGHHFTSTSTMQQCPEMNSFRFVWKKIATERYLLGELHMQDILHATNYYFLHIFRNNIGYRWAVISDDQRTADGDLQQVFTCVTEREQEKGTSNDVLNEGDRIRIDIRAIDRSAYDYLYSMQMMDNTGTNPVTNITGGCLGYFTAYYQITHNLVFHTADVEEEE